MKLLKVNVLNVEICEDLNSTAKHNLKWLQIVIE